MAVLANLALGCVVAYVGAGALLFALQRQLLYAPDRTRPDAHRAGLGQVQPVALTTADGLSLTAWFAPARTAEAPVVVYFHGNAGNIENRGDKVRYLLEAGFGALVVGYRGYGGNPGRPSEAGLLADGRAALAFLAARGVGRMGIVLYGESLGSGVAVRLATETSVAALVLEAPYTSITDVARGRFPIFPVGWLLRDHFDSAAHIDAVGAPVLIVHGSADRTIPVALGRELYARAQPPKEVRILADAGHTDLLDFGLAPIVLDFLARHTGTRMGAVVP